MDGVLNVRKPCGPTSHDVVNQVRRAYGQKRVGHAGTLDPMAEGVLVVCLGKATRLVRYLVDTRKEYRATMVLGVTTDTQDATGKVTAEHDASCVTLDALLAAAQSFAGEIEQIPPMVSAVKHQGRRLYELARRGAEVEREPRRVTIYWLELLDFRPGPRAQADIAVTCSSGTYIRTLCAEIGAGLGCGAHMKSLVRTRVGRFRIEDSVPLDVLAETPQEALGRFVLGMGDALEDMPLVTLSQADADAAAHGMPARVKTPGQVGDSVRMLGPGGELLAIGVVSEAGGIVKPKVVLIDPA